MADGPFVFQFGDFKTLPIYAARARTLEPIQPFSSGRVSIEPADPDYEPPSYGLDNETLRTIGSDANAAIAATAAWLSHFSSFEYFVQFKNDASRQLIKSLHDHTELTSTLCDARLGIDPSVLWRVFDGVFGFEAVHSEYRADEDRDAKWHEYAAKLDHVYKGFCEHSMEAIRLTQRIVKQIEFKAAVWSQLPPIMPTVAPESLPQDVLLFYSYSHKDENLRDQLENHLALLRRQGIIANWHDRRIAAGREWEGQIDAQLEAAHVILILVSSDFLASDYCYDVETKRALERHKSGDARLIPIVLRACDWSGAPFAKLQALPKDAKPITSWENIDEAFTDVALGIRTAIQDMSCAESG